MNQTDVKTMSEVMQEQQYHDWPYMELVRNILNTGVQKGDRTGTGTISLPFQQMRFNISNMSIPLLTTKKMFTRGIIHELLWYLTGSTNIQYLTDNNVHIWDEWADENGELGPVYGYQWRKWPRYEFDGMNLYGHKPAFAKTTEIDQVADVVQKLRTNPTDRRIIISSWNVADLPDMALPPCHLLYQIWTDGKKELRAHLYQRSCDVGLGVPFNIVQYSILTHMFAHVTGFQAKEFVWTGGDVHIYNNHIGSLTEQVVRDPYPSPRLDLNPEVKEMDDFKFDDIKIVGYDQFHPTIKMEVSV